MEEIFFDCGLFRLFREMRVCVGEVGTLETFCGVGVGLVSGERVKRDVLKRIGEEPTSGY